jgi:hypothetical protein
LWTNDDIVSFPISWKNGPANINQIIVRVNGVEVSKYEAEELKSRNAPSGEAQANVKITNGLNWIEIIAQDALGRKSDSLRFRVMLKNSFSRPKRYIIALGVSKYLRPEMNLEFAEKDARDIALTFADVDSRNAASIKEASDRKNKAQEVTNRTLLLTNEQVNKSTPDRIRQFISDSNENDEIILFCAGHGVLDKNLDYFYAGFNLTRLTLRKRA